MSTLPHTDRIWARDLAPLPKLLMLALARAADEGGVCDIELAATHLQQTGLTTMHIERLLDELSACGLLTFHLEESEQALLKRHYWRITLGAAASEGGAA